MDLSESIKSSAAERYGEPPYGYAELSTLKTFTKKVNLNSDNCVNNLTQAGIKIENENQTLLDIARMNHRSPQQVFLAMKPKEVSTSQKKYCRILQNPAQANVPLPTFATNMTLTYIPSCAVLTIQT